ncbi:MAG TPA: M3 family metallopeptidase [Micavibrio sp.]
MAMTAPLLNNPSLNPLINPPVLPYGAPAFDVIKAADIEPAIDWAIAREIAELDAIKNNPAPPDFANTIEALDAAGRDLSRITSTVYTLFLSKTDDDLSAAQRAISPKLQNLSSDIWMDDVLFARVDAVYQARASMNLSTEKNRLLESQHRSFISNGVHLDPAQKQRAKDIATRLGDLSIQFRENVNKSRAAYSKVIDDVADLAGLPQKFIDKMADDAHEAGHPGKWLVSFNPSPVPLLTYCDNRALRQEVKEAYERLANDAPSDNRPLAMEILQLSHELAQMHGYATAADQTLDDMMAKNQHNVYDLLHRLLQVYKPAAVQYIDEVKAFAAAHPAHPCPDLQSWDYAYYSTQYKEQRCQFDSRDFEKYLEQGRVFDGLQTHLQKAFGIEMRDQTATYPTYDPDVKVFEVHRQNNGGIVGLFYLDLYERGAAKNGGAWMSAIRDSYVDQGQRVIPSVTNNMNLMKPVGGAPTYMNLDEYITLYHEMGHALHGLLSRAQYASLAGTNVKRDWVEGPSQFNENFALLQEVVDTFAVHGDTGQPLPDALLRAAHQYNNFDAGYAGLRQVKFALMDMACYGRDPALISSTKDIEDDIGALTNVLPATAGEMLPAFTHIFGGGYSAGYYSYKWAEVIDKHLFAVATQQGNYDPASWALIEEHLYASGNTADPMDCFIAMTGTKPDPDMLLRHEGLLPARAPVAGAAAILPPKKPVPPVPKP